MKKNLCLCLALCLVFSCVSLAALAKELANEELTANDLFRYIPTRVTISKDGTGLVDGYFINMNPDIDIMSVKDFSIKVAIMGNCIAEGRFGDLKEFTVPALGMLSKVFKFEEIYIEAEPNKPLDPGTYIFSNHMFALIECSFTSVPVN